MQVTDIEQGHFLMMIDNGFVAFDADDAIDFVSNGPELTFLWCFLFHAFKISEMRGKSKDFFRLTQLFFVYAPEVSFRGAAGFELIGSTLRCYAPHAQINAHKVGVAKSGGEFFGAVLVLNHAYTLPRPHRNARDFLRLAKLFFALFA